MYIISVTIYFKKDGIHKHKSYCIVLDDMTHDVNMVFTSCVKSSKTIQKIIEIVNNDI